MVLFTFSDLMLFAAFLLALLTYIDRYDKRKQKNPTLLADRMGASQNEGLNIHQLESPTMCGGCSSSYNIMSQLLYVNYLSNSKTASI